MQNIAKVELALHNDKLIKDADIHDW